MQLTIRDFHPRLPLCYAAGNLRGIYEWMSELSLDLSKQLLYNIAMDTVSALAEPTRRTILEMLAHHGPLSATEIYAKFPASPPAISQHLKVLREAKLVHAENTAPQHIYQINPHPPLPLAASSPHITQPRNQRFHALDPALEAGTTQP